jgi:hypothetical protein
MAIWLILRRPFGIICGHLVNFTAIWYNLRSFGIFCSYLVFFSVLGMLYQEKPGNPGLHTGTKFDPDSERLNGSLQSLRRLLSFLEDKKWEPLWPGTNVMIFENNFAKKIGVSTQNTS